jgi:hypothetical protein
MMTVKEIVKKYLEDNGYDGLYNRACGCSLDDFMPCASGCDDCKPAYKIKCSSKYWCGDNGCFGPKGATCPEEGGE